jgi:hypothetical protein
MFIIALHMYTKDWTHIHAKPLAKTNNLEKMGTMYICLVEMVGTDMSRENQGTGRKYDKTI